ncbi:hypothetical protein BDY17DRAFT_322310 [Neohortaea acidophila]|uniref:Uncharacterized protein n=1 Tax=Neohortaea acidophila TaxID=245834 RepID=A0A6A6PZM6_9PEZI|nr:uncharacterized protein BDY17DRAFT_322310 [Neohortaea acidophila]KAF2485472.1 hypothetical protein BDY17DRAFT_322310 [Neohortaea acidophila]
MEHTSILQPPAEIVKTPSKPRSFSDPQSTSGAPDSSSLAPSPTFLDRAAHPSKDDHDANPITPRASSRRQDFLSRGLSLQMPPSFSMPSPSQFPSSHHRSAPLSPQLDRNNIYMQQSPATSLPRHSRGLDFARACTTLHHSTLAEGSPDSSPVITQKGVAIPGRKGSISSMMLDSPNLLSAGSGWGSLPPERSAISSSVGSVNMLASESESGDSEEDASMAGDDNDDPILTTPQVRKLQNPNALTPFHGGGTWGTGAHFSPAQASLMKTIRRTRLQKPGKRARKNSSSASGSGYSSMASPRGTSPPPLRSIESAANGGYFNWPTAARSRRESLAMGTDGLHLSSGNDSGDEASASNTPGTPEVVRRAVTRRGNLLPKTKGFARIRAALMEEAAPVDTESRREAETIRQVRERDGSLADLDLTPSRRSSTAAEQPSPHLFPTTSDTDYKDFGHDLGGAENPKGLGMNFAAHVSRNSGGLDYWNRYDSSFRTPPPPTLARHSSSAISDTNMDSSSDTLPVWRPRPRARSSASDAPSEAMQSTAQPANGVMNDDMHLNRFKRRREEDFDICTVKRRAVSPGMSANNSPVLAPSPAQKDGGGNWGQPPDRGNRNSQADMSQQRSRHGSGGNSMSLPFGSTLGPPLSSGSSGANGGRKLGLQGMVDTNDGIMKMSIE